MSGEFRRCRRRHRVWRVRLTGISVSVWSWSAVGDASWQLLSRCGDVVAALFRACPKRVQASSVSDVGDDVDEFVRAVLHAYVPHGERDSPQRVAARC